jgi:hypothetical protein
MKEESRPAKTGKAGEARGERSYANGNPRFDKAVCAVIPRSWREGIFYGAWSTSEFVKWGYFAVALHVQVLVGIFYPSFAKSISGSLGGFAFEFGTSLLIAAAFAYIMIGGHQSMHALEARGRYGQVPHGHRRLLDRASQDVLRRSHRQVPYDHPRGAELPP